MPPSAKAQRVIDACKRSFSAHKSDCSGFAKAVASELGVSLEGNADSIVEHVGVRWERLASGPAAAAAAERGDFVIAGMRGADQANPAEHGHVVVVVSGPLARDQYPTAFWGRLGAVGEQEKTLNFAWNTRDRDRITYACRSV